MPPTLLSVEGASKRFGDVVALHSIDLKINEGDIIGLVGSNGAGKPPCCDCFRGSTGRRTDGLSWTTVLTLNERANVWVSFPKHGPLCPIDRMGKHSLPRSNARCSRRRSLAQNVLFCSTSRHDRSTRSAHKGVLKRHAPENCASPCACACTVDPAVGRTNGRLGRDECTNRPRIGSTTW